jgi:hypothetical protein
MPLQTIHRYTSHAKHKTAASIRSVLSHRHSKSLPDFLAHFSKQSAVSPESDADRLKESPDASGVLKFDNQERIYDVFGGDSK